VKVGEITAGKNRNLYHVKFAVREDGFILSMANPFPDIVTHVLGK